MGSDPARAAKKIEVFYDGDCPFCSNYVALVRLREALGLPVELIDARRQLAQVEVFRRAGYDLDLGMLVRVGEQVYFGSEAIHFLALLSTERGVLRRLNRIIFRHREVARLLYPLMRFIRALTLRVLGRVPLSP